MFCRFNQNSGVVLKAADSSQAVSGVMPRLPRTISLMRCRGMPRCSASAFCVSPEGSRYSFKRMTPGCVATRCDGIMVQGLCFSVVVHNVHFCRIAAHPSENDSPLGIDANAVKSCTVALQRFQTVARWHAQILQRGCRIEDVQLVTCGLDNLRWQAANSRAADSVVKIFRDPVTEGFDHEFSLEDTRYPCNANGWVEFEAERASWFSVPSLVSRAQSRPGGQRPTPCMTPPVVPAQA